MNTSTFAVCGVLLCVLLFGVLLLAAAAHVMFQMNRTKDKIITSQAAELERLRAARRGRRRNGLRRRERTRGAAANGNGGE